MPEFSNQLDGVLIVTGAGGGIGQAIVLEAIRSGCTRIVAADISESGLRKTTELKDAMPHPLCTAQVIHSITNVTSETEVDAMVALAINRFGRVDYLANNAGVVCQTVPTHEMDMADFDKVLGVDLRGALLVERAVLKAMLGQEMRELPHGIKVRGSIVNMSSTSGVVGFATLGPYSIAKHGLLGLTRCSALEYATQGIRINAVLPGSTANTSILPEGHDEFIKQVVEAHPMKRMAYPEEVAAAVMFLLSDKASCITGAELKVDGGYTAQ